MDKPAGRIGCVRNLTSGRNLSGEVFVAHNFWLRFKGLMGTASLSSDQGMLFPHTNSVHMFFMRYPLLIVYLSADWQVMKVVTLKPWALGPIVWKAAWVLELDVQWGPWIAPGDRLVFEPA